MFEVEINKCHKFLFCFESPGFNYLKYLIHQYTKVNLAE